MTVTVLIQGDPEESHVPAEALRIGLGLISGQHDVHFILMGKAPLLLGEESEDLVDGEELQKYLPALQEMDLPFHVEKKSQAEIPLQGTPWKIIPVSLSEISALIAQSDRHLVF